MSKVFKSLLRPPTVFKVAKQFLAIELGTGLPLTILCGEPILGLAYMLICHMVFMVITSREPHAGTIVNVWFLRKLELIGVFRHGFPRSFTPMLYKMERVRCYYER